MKVKADLAKNRLYIKMSGVITKKEYEKLYTEVRFCVADLLPSFNVIADYSECNFAQLTGMSVYRKLMNYLIKNEVSEVVRVVSDDSLLYKQVNNLSSQICGYKPIYTKSIEEAEKRLDSSKKRRGLRFHDSALPLVEYYVEDKKFTGPILNISTSGCAIGLASKSPSVDENVTIKIAFNNKNIFPYEFKIKTQVVRTSENEFAVEFRDLEGDQKDNLLKCLLHETERDL